MSSDHAGGGQGKEESLTNIAKSLAEPGTCFFFFPVSCVHKIIAKQLLLKYPVWTLKVELNWMKRSESVQLGGSSR